MRRPNNTTKSFIDLLFNILICFFMLLMLTVMMINPKAKNKDIELKAELIIGINWDESSSDDVDLMLKAPNGDVVFFGRTNIKHISLDRDDRGTLHDVVQLEDGKFLQTTENWENIVIRKLMPGEYTINVFMFRKNDAAPTKVNVKVQKLNPYTSVFSDSIIMTEAREEHTFINFTVDQFGKIKDLHTTQESFQSIIKPTEVHGP